MKTLTHGGNIRLLAARAGCPAGEVLDFSANLNPLGPPEWLRPLIASQISSLVHYPDPDCSELLAAAAECYQVPQDELVAANGTEELLCWLPRILGKPRALVPVPGYVDYARTARAAGLEVVTLPLAEGNGFRLDLSALEQALRGDEIVYLGHPNNPTGLALDAPAVRALIARHPRTFFIIDEAFADFVSDCDRFYRDRLPNTLVLLSLTKIFAVPGLRIGCAAASPGVIRQLREVLPPWSVNTLAQAVGATALADRQYVAETRRFVREQRESQAERLAALPGLRIYPGEANFLLVRITAGKLRAPELAERLLARGIAIRTCDNFDGLDDRFFRVAVRTTGENERLVEALAAEFHTAQASNLSKRRTPAIMFQGTSSNAGKSVLTAALCRILRQDGLSVAPYKSQNMSLNSFVTRDGLEMGRAQVVQAQACRIEPDARMNPILLKPNSNTGSQVIVLGKPVGNMNVGQYIKYKPEAFTVAKQAYDSLAAAHDVVVLEGAGSPAEVNLKRHDIVNMGMARHAAAPVLLVGDIDRGGVYASFVGTMEVLSESERAMVAGFVVNRFRGQESLLADAHDYVLRHTGCPVVGVVPYLTNLGLPEEDSVSFKAETSHGAMAALGQVDIAVLDLPHVSNFTDMDALRVEPDVSLRIVRRLEELGQPDAVILPGSKHVTGDLAQLRATGLADAVLALAAAGRTEIIGICGGYQMLGRSIADPLRVESDGRPVAGLGLLGIDTVMAPEKTLQRVEGLHPASGSRLTGYEIHHGLSGCDDSLEKVVLRDDGEVIGTGRGLVWGSYLHGIFDADPFRRWLIDRLRVRRGLDPLGQVVAVYDIDAAFDRLAAVVRERLDMKRIYQLLKL
ncbi:MAG: cobyric acid synthase [Verrucomicrobiota bacterium JB025]|nr:cobyric acid synthase [Verrucomicrobiota bacterium JB025]